MPSKAKIYPFRLDDERRARYEAAAQQAGLQLAPWMREHLDAAVEATKGAPRRTGRLHPEPAAVVHVPGPEIGSQPPGGKRYSGPDFKTKRP